MVDFDKIFNELMSAFEQQNPMPNTDDQVKILISQTTRLAALISIKALKLYHQQINNEKE